MRASAGMSSFSTSFDSARGKGQQGSHKLQDSLARRRHAVVGERPVSWARGNGKAFGPPGRQCHAHLVFRRTRSTRSSRTASCTRESQPEKKLSAGVLSAGESGGCIDPPFFRLSRYGQALACFSCWRCVLLLPLSSLPARSARDFTTHRATDGHTLAPVDIAPPPERRVALGWAACRRRAPGLRSNVFSLARFSQCSVCCSLLAFAGVCWRVFTQTLVRLLCDSCATLTPHQPPPTTPIHPHPPMQDDSPPRPSR